ncbi:hypothetical protein [Stakelama tenebrarum]|uniref:Uncharacterized protein n=1 Tax=Stakelama tenebrarum TaxID=2711215 RepID=A0A6G6Y5I8_9SPHN|nr:hypothetical protein [Sphingosinithalassobacter tenebrarum]QIG80111.1 hypothetical protein G5C33_10185 [Sphingosinithalassobacter tenebrarum]
MFGAATRGRLAAAKYDRELAMSGAWWTEYFARQDPLKPLQDYLRKREPAKPQSPAERISQYQAMKANGIDVTITRVPRKR